MAQWQMEGMIQRMKKDERKGSIKLEKMEIPKISKEASQEILKKIFANVLKAIGIMLYFVILNLAFVNMKQERLIEDIKVFSGAFLVIGLLALEKAYNKDRGDIAISSIELLVMSLHSLSIMHVIKLYQYDFRLYLLTSSYVFSIYYILKSIVIYTRERKAYLNSLSDISEIVKKDEPIKKEAKKRGNKEETKENTKEDTEEKIEEKVNKKQEKPKNKAKKEENVNKEENKKEKTK